MASACLGWLSGLVRINNSESFHVANALNRRWPNQEHKVLSGYTGS